MRTFNMSWKNAFIILSALIIILMPVLSQDFGQNGDENVEIIYGHDIWNYYTKGDKQALDYDNPPHPLGGNIQGMQFYGGMFDIITESLHHVFPSWHIVFIRHFIASIFGALLMIFTGLLAFRLSNKNWMLAVLSTVFLFLSPRIFGESMNNGKDIPFAMGMVMGVYFLVALQQELMNKKNCWKEALGLGLSWAIVIGTRSAGALLFVMYTGIYIAVYYWLNKAAWAQLKEQQFQKGKKLAVYLLSAFVVGYALGLFTWPYALQSPVSNFFAALQEMSNRTVNIRVLFSGQYFPSTEMPWYYELKWILVSSPAIIIICAVASLALLPKLIKQYSGFSLFVLLFAALFPLLYIIYKHSTVYDTWRHVFFVYPFWVILAAFFVGSVRSYFSAKLQWLPFAIITVGLLPVLVWTVKSHPNQYVYFNEFVGGEKGALGNYDLDYYHASGNQTAAWILKNVPKPKNGKKLIVLSNMDGMDTYFRNDTDWVTTNYCRYYERNQTHWDYFISFGRFISLWQLQNDKWPPSNTVYKLNVAGDVPIGIVMQQKSQESVIAYEAFKKQDYAAAITHYQNFLQVDQSDEMVYLNYAIALASVGRLNESVDAINKAIQLDGSRPDFYDILAKIYQAMGNQAKAQEAMLKMQAAMNM